MSLTDRYTVRGSLWVDYNRKERLWVAWKPHVSACFNNAPALLKFCAWPSSTPTGVAFREWVKQCGVGESKENVE